MAKKKYVSLNKMMEYDPLIKAWFEEKVNSVSIMNLDYNEEERILEFTEITGNSGDSGNSGENATTVETCTLKFPKLEDTSTLNNNEEIYFTIFIDNNLFCSKQSFITLCSVGATLEVVKNSIIATTSYTIPDTISFQSGLIQINERAFVVNDDVVFEYADGAPS